MAIRNTQLVLKNSNIPNKPFSGGTFLQGEAFVNTADGILMFSGNTQSTSEWTPAGTGGNANFFEVGSNLYDLRLRNRLTKYEGISGSGLIGKFLSGTTNGFVLADISSITGVDTYVTGFTYQDNVFTIKQNNGQPNLTATINEMTGLTVNGTLSATTANLGTINVNNLTITGTATYNKTATGSTELVNYGTLTAFTQTNDVYVTGNTLTAANNDTNTQSAILDYHGTPIGGPYAITTQNTFTTGGTYSNSTKLVTFKRNDGLTGYTVDLSTLDTNDTYVTGGTITTTPSNTNISGVTTLSYSDNSFPNTYTLPFTDVFTTGFTYDAGTNTFSVPSDGTVNVGTGGLNVGGDAVIQGSLTVFGPSVSAFTSNLYVEDPNITLNYNPTGNTTVTSVGAGWTIQDGSGIANTATTLNIGVSYLNANLSPNTEYTAATGNENRNFFSPIGDIIIRNTNGDASAPNGVRLLGENDTLNGGSY